MAPGVLLVSTDGLLEVDNTFPARLGSYLTLREAEVASLVLGGDRRA